MKARKFAPRPSIPFPFEGGMNTADDQTSLKPGHCRLLKNFEHVPGIGYRRVLGHQRVDGVAANAIIYTGVPFIVGNYTHSSPPAVGSTVTQGGATGTVTAVWEVNVGFDGGFFLAPSSGTFTSGAVTIAAFVGTAGLNTNALVGVVTRDTMSRTLNDCINLHAFESYKRSRVTAVPGEGAILGVWVYNGEVYAFRNAVGGATAVMWKMTTSGWVSQKTGLAPSGRYRFVNHNFGGAAGGVKMYGVSGVHKAFQWDGTTWTDITTGMSTDTPTHIAVHLSRLFLAFPKGSVQWSSTNVPTTWSAITGAGEIGLGEEITAIRSLRSDQLLIAGESRVFALYGASFATIDLVPILSQTGSFADCLLDVGGQAIACSQIGAFMVQQGQVSGDYQPKPFSRPIEEEIRASIAANQAAGKRMFAIFSKALGQLRLFSPADQLEYRLAFVGTKPYGWSVVSAASTSTGQQDVTRYSGTEGFSWGSTNTSATYTASGAIVCACVGSSTAGEEVMYGGTEGGFVVRFEQGNSFDGMPMSCEALLVQHAIAGAGRVGRVHGVAVEIEYQPDVSGKIGVETKCEVIADYGRGESESVTAKLAVADNLGLIDNYAVAPVSQDPTTATSASVEVPLRSSGKTVAARLFFWQYMTPPFTLKSGRYDVQPLAHSK